MHCPCGGLFPFSSPFSTFSATTVYSFDYTTGTLHPRSRKVFKGPRKGEKPQDFRNKFRIPIYGDEYEDDNDDEQDDEEDLEERGMLNKKVEAAVKENRQLRRENRRYEKALTFLKKRIDEVNLFNARLAAASDMMRKISLTKDEKERVIEHFDRARTVSEVKRTYRALAEGYRASNRRVRKQRIARPNVQSVLTEDQKNQNTNQSQFARMSELAGL